MTSPTGPVTDAEMAEAAHGVHDAARGYAMTDSTFTREEIDLFRQWFDAVEDTQNPAAPYLEDADYALAGRIAEMLGTRAPKRRKPARPI